VRIKSSGFTVALSLVMGFLVMAGGGPLRAEDAGPTVIAKRARRRHHRVTTSTTTYTAAPAVPVGRSIDELQGEVSNLRTESVQTSTEVKQIQQAINVAPPPANTAPKTIGEHVATVEQGLTDLRKDIATNLGVHIHGLMDATYDYNFNRPNTAGTALSSSGSVNELREFDVDAQSFTFQQFNLHIDKSADGGVGFVTDLNFGKTAEVLWASTHYSNSTTPQSTQEFDPTQAYLTYTIPLGKGINLQAGKFVTLLGAEVIPVYNNTNFNESRGLLFTWGEPLTHTGVRGQYTFNDKFSLTMGVNNGWDDPSDFNGNPTVEGEFSFTPTENLSMVLNGTYGSQQANHSNSKLGAIDPIVTWKTPIKGLQFVGEYLYASETAPIAVTPFVTSQGNSLNGVTELFKSADWQGFAGYGVYDLNDNIEFATRFEWFRDSQGVRTGLRQTLFEVTETLNYKVPLVNGLLARLEYRHDASNWNPFYSSDNLLPGTPFLVPSHTYDGQDTLLAAAVYTF
jgi:Putative beta-barrel porin-2, OmpL-like. bbp2